MSGRENAFDKLVNLFPCKLVDETENPHDLKFYWKGVAYDTHFELLDRLQQLYQAGMGKFLGEAITYINQHDVNNALRFIRQNPDATQRAVWNLFIQQKFFTNNDFSLIDVHNEKLFYQNAEVLLKILQMWQDIRLTGDNKHNQFLGDMFEGFLDQGVKQSEGQFFTPMPICRFILMSLPLESLVKTSGSPPKAIDYACGAGHFLNELATQLKPLVEQHQQTDLSHYHQAIFGIEKEYRLSKIAKVSAFMYGQRDINICYGDALVNQHLAFPGISDNSFDLLVANPPYSVRGFLETLPDAERDAYSLSATIDKLDSSNSIEAFFIERAKQLLKAGGVAAIILPSSILSNGGTTYVKIREILLQYFDIVAIAEFGSGTFGKTGTNTVTLFLRRKATAPDTAQHYRERVNEWFNASLSPLPVGESRGEGDPYQDMHLYHQYAAHIGIHPDDYRSLFTGQFSDTLLAHDTFAEYRKAFDRSTEIVNLRNQRAFSNKPKTEQEEILNKRFVSFVQTTERDKLYHFVLANSQSNPLLIIKSPSDNKAQKRFLGYEWSSAKGNEGIKLDKDAHGHHQTALYDETCRDNTEKISTYIAANFDGDLSAVPDALSEVVSITRLVDMLDFSRVSFDKQIILAAKKTIDIQSKWPLVKLGDICSFDYGKPLPEEKRTNGEYPVMGSNGRVGFHNECLVKGPSIIVGRKGSAGEVIWENDDCFPIDTTFYITLKNNNLILGYLFLALKSLKLDQLRGGTGVPGLNRNEAYQLKISLPPLDIQQQIVVECEAVDKEVCDAQAVIEATKKNINEQVATAFKNSRELKGLDQIADLSRGASPRPINEFLTEEMDGIPWIKIGDVASGAKYIKNTAQKITKAGAAKSKLVQKGDFIISNSMSVGRPYILGIDGCVHDGWLVLANIQQSIDKDYLYYALSSESAQAQFQEKALGGVVKNLNIERAKGVKIPVPPLADQQRLVAEIEKLEQTITAAQKIIDEAASKKQAILKQYL